MSEASAPASPDGTSAEVRIAPLRRRHLRRVMRLERATDFATWSSGVFLNELAAAHRCYLAALGPPVLGPGRAVLGYAGTLQVGPDVHVTRVVVDAAARRTGIGTRLLLVLARVARARGAEAMTLEVAASNAPAIALYERFGFVTEGRRENYYAELGEDALVLWMSDLATDAAARRLDAVDASLDPPLLTEGIDLDDPASRPATGATSRRGSAA